MSILFLSSGITGLEHENNNANSVVICDTVNTFYNASYWYYFYDQPLDRYHLVISDGTDEAEGWFNNFRLVAVKLH